MIFLIDMKRMMKYRSLGTVPYLIHALVAGIGKRNVKSMGFFDGWEARIFPVSSCQRQSVVHRNGKI